MPCPVLKRSQRLIVNADRLVPVVPPLLIPDADREAEGVAPFGQRQRPEAADEMFMLGAVIGVADRIGRAEAEDLVIVVEQLEFGSEGVLRRADRSTINEFP